MHPAFSIIYFTTAAGAGYGLLIMLGVLAPLQVVPAGGWFGITAMVLALALVTVGLLASTIHLGHPERAWRALSQWRSSWLSREGVASLVTYGPALLFAIVWALLGRSGPVTWVSGIAMAILAVITIACTAMIYASLKPIHQWHNAWTMPNYLALAVMTGAVLLNALLHLWGAADARVDVATAAFIAVSALVKEAYWHFIATVPASSTPESATGLGGLGKVRFLEAPHSEPNYLVKEMGFEIGRKHSARLRMVARALGFVVPLIATVAALFAPPAAATVAAVVAALSVAIGIVVERWLFFAEATHTVSLYYGAQVV